ncbi:MAG TPA: energy transducer TonB [Mucilaginibacter sp.]|nr:energy transducer TonB [Mucilaginibacter sp.]
MKKTLLFVLFTATIGIAHGQQSTAPPPPLPAKQADPDSVAVDTNKIFRPIDQEPIFPGGMAKLYQYILKNLKYPKEALENKVQGRVLVSFIIEKDGTLTDIKVSKGLTPETDAEAIRLIQACPKWRPGTQGGRPVRVQYIIPIKFELP